MILKKSCAPILIFLAASFLTACCASSRTHALPPPASLLDPIRIPPRSDLRTVGDMARLLLADEKAMQMKNADLAALRHYWLDAQK